MCIPGHSRDSVCLHCHPARLPRSGTRQGIAPGNRCAEPCPTQRPPATPGTMAAPPCRGRGRYRQTGLASTRAPGHTRGSPGPAPTRCCRHPRSMRRRENVQTRPPGLSGGQKPGGHQHRRRRVPPTPKGSTSRKRHRQARRMPRRPWAAHAPVAPGIRPGGTRLPGRPPIANSGSTAPATRRPPRAWPGNSQRKTPGFPGVLTTSREIPVSQYGGGGRN